MNITPFLYGVLFITILAVQPLEAKEKEKKMEENTTVTAIAGVKVGNYSDYENLTGCTVIRFPKEGAVAAVDVRGAAPGTRETDLLEPMNLVQRIHALVLSGGSAYGLDTASGVMRCLEEEDTGFPVGNGLRVPIVPAAVLFDLGVGNGHVRPTAANGYDACKKADSAPVSPGNFGAGTGATVGKLLGPGHIMKGGLGSSLIHLPNGGKVAALFAVNPFGEVTNGRGEVLAGIRAAQKGKMLRAMDVLLEKNVIGGFQGKNTTIGLVVTDLPLDKSQLKKVAQMAHDGMARSIQPAHTMYDGDTIFAVSVSQKNLPEPEKLAGLVNLVGAAAAQATSQAIENAVLSAKTLQGIPAAGDH